MTPQEITDYKTKWMNNPHFQATIHSDLRYICQKWCKLSVGQEKFKYVKFTNVYEDTLHFQTECDWNRFNTWYIERQTYEKKN